MTPIAPELLVGFIAGPLAVLGIILSIILLIVERRQRRAFAAAQQLVDQINAVRVSRGLPPLGSA